jgi:hypothetical protein
MTYIQPNDPTSAGPPTQHTPDITLTHANKASSQPGAQALPVAEPVTKSLTIPKALLGRVFGRNGRNIRKLCDDHYVSYKVIATEDPQESTIEITGFHPKPSDAIQHIKTNNRCNEDERGCPQLSFGCRFLHQNESQWLIGSDSSDRTHHPKNFQGREPQDNGHPAPNHQSNRAQQSAHANHPTPLTWPNNVSQQNRTATQHTDRAHQNQSQRTTSNGPSTSQRDQHLTNRSNQQHPIQPHQNLSDTIKTLMTVFKSAMDTLTAINSTVL